MRTHLKFIPPTTVVGKQWKRVRGQIPAAMCLSLATCPPGCLPSAICPCGLSPPPLAPHACTCLILPLLVPCA